MERRGLFLSNDGFSRVVDAFNAFSEGNTNALTQILYQAKKAIWRDNFEDFNDVYLATYVMNLLNEKTLARVDQNVGLYRDAPSDYTRYSLRVLMDIDAPALKEKPAFTETLVDEWSLIKVYDCVQTIRSMLPYTVNIEGYGLGCIWVECGIYADTSLFEPTESLPFLEKQEIESSLSSEGNLADGDFSPLPPGAGPWANLKNRFPICALELSSK